MILGWTESFCVFQMKKVFFKNIFTIFDQLYNFHYLYNLCNGKTNIKNAETNDSIAYAYAISSKTQKLSVQPNNFKCKIGYDERLLTFLQMLYGTYFGRDGIFDTT
jgi:hypothetical protein